MIPLSFRFSMAWRALVGAFPTVSDRTAAGLLIGVTQREAPLRSAVAFLEAYSTMPHLRNVSHRIADSVASTEWKLVAVRRGGRFRRMPDLRYGSLDVRTKTLKDVKQAGELVEVEAHPLLRGLYGSDNPVLTGYSIRFLTQLYLDILGEAFWVKERGRGDIPVSFWPIPPTWIQGTPTPSDPKYRVSYRSWQAEIPDTEMVWFKDPDPVNPYGRGSGVARSLADELDIDEYAAKHTKSWFYNDALPSAIVSPADGHINDSAISQVRQKWMEEHQGFWRRFRIHFSSRKLDVQKLSQTFSDQQLIPLRQHERDIVVQTLNIPPEMVGILSSSNRATIEASSYIYATNVVVPRLERLRELIQEWIIPEYEDPEKLFVVYESPVPEDHEFQLDVAKAQPQALTQNEWREMAGLGPLPTGNVHHVPFNVSPQVSLGGVALRNGRQSRALYEPEPTKQLKQFDEDDEFYLLVHRVADRLTPRLQMRFREVIRVAQQSIDMRALEAALRDRLAQAAEDAIPWGQIRESLREASSRTFTQAVIGTGREAAGELGSVLGTSITFNEASPAISAFASSQSALLVTRIEEPSREAIRQAVARVFEAVGETAETAARSVRDRVGLLPRQESALAKFEELLIEEGRSPSEIARRVEARARAMVRQRSRTIARTELIDAANEGQQQLWRQASQEGLLDAGRARRYWVVTDDDRLDAEVCEPIPFLNEGGVGLEEPFVTPVGPMMRPTAHPNCRCAVTLQVK